jgi:nickel/cobalt exporter
MRRFRGAIASLFAVFLVAGAGVAGAHPLGNFTVNHVARLTVRDGRVQVRYVLDLAEIPSFAVLRALDPQARPSRERLARWANERGGEIGPSLILRLDGTERALRLERVAVATRPGAAGLRTISLRAEYAFGLAPGPHRIAFRDDSERGRIGWHDVVVGGEREPTDELRSYPPALLGSPRDRRARSFALTASGPLDPRSESADAGVASPAAASLARPDAFAALLARASGSAAAIALAVLIAGALGALHALEPGHGKTLLAVTLVGARATPRQALILASALTAAHTGGVFVLGAIVLGAARWIVPEAIYPSLTLLSGIVVAALAARALSRAIGSRAPHAHAHGDASHRHHHELSEAHARLHTIAGSAPLTFRGAVLAAMSGNVAPCPAALVVLLASIAQGRLAYGLLLIVAFGAGLALVLTGLGIAVVRGAAWLAARPPLARVIRFGPLVTAWIMAAIGAAIVAQGFAQAGIAAPSPLVTSLALLAISGYAFAATSAHSADSAL